MAPYGGQRMGAVIPTRQRGQGGAFLGKLGGVPAGGMGRRRGPVIPGGGWGGENLKTCETENLNGCLGGSS